MATEIRALATSLLLLSGCQADKKPAPSESESEPEPRMEGAVVTEVRGEVTQGGAALGVGDAVDPTQELLVGKGRATIELPDGATVRLYSNTRIRLGERDRVRLFFGKVWALIAPRFERRFVVETENAVAGVRGTELIVEASTQRTRVAVIAGEVEVENRGPRPVKRQVSRGQEVIVRAEAPPSQPAPFVAAPEKKAWDDLGELLAPTPHKNTEPMKPRRPKNAIEREGEETRRKLIEEGRRKKRELQEESRKTRRALEEEEAGIRRELEEKEKRAKEGGSVKDFLD